MGVIGIVPFPALSKRVGAGSKHGYMVRSPVMQWRKDQDLSQKGERGEEKGLCLRLASTRLEAPVRDNATGPSTIMWITENSVMDNRAYQTTLLKLSTDIGRAHYVGFSIVTLVHCGVSFSALLAW